MSTIRTPEPRTAIRFGRSGPAFFKTVREPLEGDDGRRAAINEKIGTVAYKMKTGVESPTTAKRIAAFHELKPHDR